MRGDKKSHGFSESKGGEMDGDCVDFSEDTGSRASRWENTERRKKRGERKKGDKAIGNSAGTESEGCRGN